MTIHEQTAYHNLTSQQVKTRLAEDSSIRSIDVREAQEHTLAHIEGAGLLPMSEAQQWLTTLPRDQEIFSVTEASDNAHVANYPTPPTWLYKHCEYAWWY